MGHLARGDSKKVTYSSEDDENCHTRAFISATTIHRMSKLNFLDVNHNFVGLSGEEAAPPILISTLFDETDRQFWAEDELSSSESKNKLVAKRRRRHSVAYRNRAIVQRSRTAQFRSSSSNSGLVYLKFSSACRHCTITGKESPLRRTNKKSKIGKRAVQNEKVFKLNL